MEIRTMASFLSPRRRGRRPSDRRRTAVRTELRPLESRSLLSGYNQLNLVGYRPGMARRTDPDLNGWGLDFDPRHLHDARAPGRRPLQTIGAGPRMSPGAARDRDVSAPSRGLDGPSGQYEGRVAISMMLTPAHLRVDAVTTEPTGPVV